MLMIKYFSLAFLLLLKIPFSVSEEVEFTFNGFTGANLTLDGAASIKLNGLLKLTFEDIIPMTGHAFHPSPIPFGRTTSSFSTTFVFAIIPEFRDVSGHGLAFFISPTDNFYTALSRQYLGLFNTQSNGSLHSSHYILGWSFKLNGTTPSIDLSKLPNLPSTTSKGRSKVLDIVIPCASAAFLFIVVTFLFLYVKRRFKYAEMIEDWEVEFGPHRFSYKDLYRATNGFKEKELLGSGGFGRVYRGVLPVSKLEVAVKRVTHESNQGIKQFIAEVVSIGRLRHRNLVQLLGYCRKKGELLLVYDYMPNGSLDKYLYGQENLTLNWIQRFKIIKGVASGLLYLHEDWEQVVIHRDVKASNVLLDCDLNSRLGDFGLAKLYDRDTDPQTTHVAGTMGYIAPELARTGKATPLTDVFAFGAFLLEVVCSKRPLHSGAHGERIILVDRVLEHWKFGSLADIVDPRLGGCYIVEEVDMVLKLGLLCSHPLPSARPSMRQAVQYLEGDAPLPDLSAICMNFSTPAILPNEGFDSYVMSHPSTMTSFSGLSGGR
ncbi:L-type lectin-domain containing receptor kinase SIT2-like isoform X2 [Carex rostrata]